MFRFNIISGILFFICLIISSYANVEKMFGKERTCEVGCLKRFSKDMLVSCWKGCYFYSIINYRKSLNDHTQTVELCRLDCAEGFINKTTLDSCNMGCALSTIAEETEKQTTTTLGPLLRYREFHRFEQIIRPHMILLDIRELVAMKSNPNLIKPSQNSDESSVETRERLSTFDWVDCFSTSSGIPRWILLSTLLGFILFLMWLCCSTTITAPAHHIHTSKPEEFSYVFLQDPYNDVKKNVTSIIEVEAPPLPEKSPLI